MSQSAQAPPLEATIRSLMRRSKLAIFLGSFLRWSGMAMGASGTLVLFLRAIYREVPLAPPAYLVPILLGLGVALYWTGKRRLSRQGAAAWIDVHAGGSGLVVTGAELDDERWKSAVLEVLARSHALPSLQLKRPASAALCGLGFLSLALFIQIPEPAAPGASQRFVANLTENLASKLQALSESIVLEEELAEEFQERLQRIQELAEEAPTESIFEAIDRLEQRLGLEGERVSKDMQASLGDLWQSMQDGSLDQESLQQILERAKGLLAKGGFDENLPEDLLSMLGSNLELPEGMQLNPAELMKLAQGLSGLLEGSMGKLLGAGLLDASKLSLASKFAKLENFLPTGHKCDEECREAG